MDFTRCRTTAIALIILLLLPACTHVISYELRQKVRKGASFPAVLHDPEAFIGDFIVWGGVIIETLNKEEGSVIKILETPLNYRGRPGDEEYSRGRFLAKTSRFMDSEVFRKGRKVTIAGKIVGKELQPLGEISYTYPVVLIKELYLWKEEPVRYFWPPYPPYYWDWYWYPYYWPRYRFRLYYPHHKNDSSISAPEGTAAASNQISSEHSHQASYQGRGQC